MPSMISGSARFALAMKVSPIAPTNTATTLERIAALVEETRTAGDLVVELAKRSSAYYAPSAAIAELADSVHMNLNRVFSVSRLLDGEYGINGLFVGVPVKLGNNGVEEIFQMTLSADEHAALKRSAAAVKELCDVISV